MSNDRSSWGKGGRGKSNSKSNDRSGWDKGERIERDWSNVRGDRWENDVSNPQKTPNSHSNSKTNTRDNFQEADATWGDRNWNNVRGDRRGNDVSNAQKTPNKIPTNARDHFQEADATWGDRNRNNVRGDRRGNDADDWTSVPIAPKDTWNRDDWRENDRRYGWENNHTKPSSVPDSAKQQTRTNWKPGAVPTITSQSKSKNNAREKNQEAGMTWNEDDWSNWNEGDWQENDGNKNRPKLTSSVSHSLNAHVPASAKQQTSKGEKPAASLTSNSHSKSKNNSKEKLEETGMTWWSSDEDFEQDDYEPTSSTGRTGTNQMVATKGKGSNPAIVQDASKSNNFQSRTSATTRSFLTEHRFKDLTSKCRCPYSISAITGDEASPGMGYEFLTRVQHETIPHTFDAKDVFAKAKTGTGKTLAFLLPVVEKAYRGKTDTEVSWGIDRYVGALVLSPTRELASQIAEEAKALTGNWGAAADANGSKGAKGSSGRKGKPKGGKDNRNGHNDSMSAPTFNIVLMYGGVDIKKDNGALAADTIDLMICTPGRLQDHLQRNTLGICDRILNCPFGFTFVLDEADQLLEMGFRDAIKAIETYLPAKESPSRGTNGSAVAKKPTSSLSHPCRQTLLFSATVSEPIKAISTLVLRTDYTFVDSIGDDEPTVAQVAQKLIVLEEHTELVSSLFALLQELSMLGHTQKDYFRPKVIVFLPTARQAQICAETALPFFKGKSVEVFEIHSRKSQAARTKASDLFRDFADDSADVAPANQGNSKKGTKGKGGSKGESKSSSKEAHAAILFSSDVTARGLDYPLVSHVVQCGAPASREQYLHRLGRTARAGAAGQGILMLCAFENYVLHNKDFNLSEFFPETPDKGKSNKGKKGGGRGAKAISANLNAPEINEDMVHAVETAMMQVDSKTKAQAYSAWLGYYNGLCPKRIAWTKEQLVEEAYNYAYYCLLVEEHDCPPMLQKKTVGMMGLKGVPGLRISSG